MPGYADAPITFRVPVARYGTTGTACDPRSLFVQEGGDGTGAGGGHSGIEFIITNPDLRPAPCSDTPRSPFSILTDDPSGSTTNTTMGSLLPMRFHDRSSSPPGQPYATAEKYRCDLGEKTLRRRLRSACPAAPTPTRSRFHVRLDTAVLTIRATS